MGCGMNRNGRDVKSEFVLVELNSSCRLYPGDEEPGTIKESIVIVNANTLTAIIQPIWISTGTAST